MKIHVSSYHYLSDFLKKRKVIYMHYILFKLFQNLKIKVIPSRMIQFRKKLNPLLSQTNFKRNQTQIDPISEIASSLRILSDKIKDLVQNKGHQSRYQAAAPEGFHNMDRMEDRFQRVYEQIPTLPSFQPNNIAQRKHLIEVWLGKICQQIFSITFSMFQLQKLNDRKAKAFCCQNMLLSIIKMIRQNNLTVEQISIMDECLKKQLLPYFLIKYPMSQEAEVNLEFANKIVEIDSIGENFNDLVIRSGVQFNYREDKNYNEEIMRFLNYVIELPGREFQGLKEDNLFKQFYSDMESFFKKIQDERFTIIMNKYDPKKQQYAVPKQLREDTKQKVSLEQQKQMEKYRQRVKTFTKRLIGRKISENIKPYSQLQIKQRNFQLKNPAIMRIATKWCSQLMENFDTLPNILNKEEQFRMKNGEQKILKRKHLLILAQLLNREKKNVDQYLKKVNENNHQSQYDFGSQPVPRQMQKFLQEECQVGLFAASMIRNYQAYLIGYINTILHSLMNATKDYQQVIKAYEYKQEEYGESIQKWRKGKIIFSDLVDQAYSYRLTSVPVTYRELVPQLVSFKIGDILRCKCLSKQKQIIALYTQLERISKQPNSIMKIVRIKNRLEKGTKDILINLLYRDKLLIEMQLGVATNGSKFIDFSNKYNHVLYQLQRAQFGPISQMCNIWINNDVKAGFYIEQTKKINERKVNYISNQEHLDHMCKGQKLNFPFRCSVCSHFYTDCSYVLSHIQCSDPSCRKKVCSICRAQTFDYKKLKSKFPALPQTSLLQMRQNEKYWLFNQRIKEQIKQRYPQVRSLSQLQGQGVLIDLKGDDRKPIFYKIMKSGKKYFLLKINDARKPELMVLKELTTRQQIETFKKQYLIFNTNKLTECIFKPIGFETFKNFLTQYNFPKYMQKAYEKEKCIIVFMAAGLTNENLDEINLDFPSTHKLCFYDNNLKAVDKIIEKFANSQIIDLGENKVQRLAYDSRNQKIFTNLKVLYLNYNKISVIDPSFIERVPNLQQLQLAANKLKELPTNFSKLSKLKILNISQNLISKMPDQVTKFENLQVLNMYAFKHQQIKLVELSESIGKLKKLRKLNINFNEIVKLPDSICELQNLEVFYAIKNKLEVLPKYFGKLNKLKILNFAENNFDDLPQQIGFLKELQILNFQYASHTEKPNKALPDSFTNLTELKVLDISKNKLAKLPENIGNMAKIESLFIYQNELQAIPTSIGGMKQLHYLYASNNHFRKIPESICQLTNLEKLTLKDNRELTQLPSALGLLKNLKQLIVQGSDLKSLPANIGQLNALQTLKLKDNSIRELPSSFSKLTRIKTLELDVDQLDDNSQKLYKNLMKDIVSKKNI